MKQKKKLTQEERLHNLRVSFVEHEIIVYYNDTHVEQVNNMSQLVYEVNNLFAKEDTFERVLYRSVYDWAVSPDGTLYRTLYAMYKDSYYILAELCGHGDIFDDIEPCYATKARIYAFPILQKYICEALNFLEL